MVAIVTGKGPGLETSSNSVLGSRGTLGSAALGRSEEGVYVNAATGNLVVTDSDEMLVGLGPDAVVSRTYNSLGAWDGDNDDYWRAGAYRRVYGLTGGSGYGTAGSTVKRTDWDGSDITYSWNANYFSAGVGAYVATDGAGAYDILVKSGSAWTWTDGDTGITESYDDSNSGRITARTDRDGNAVAYSYTGALLTRVTTADGGYTSLVYGGAGGLQLQYLETHSTWPAVTTTRVFYEYDASDRLSKVKVNLAPEDNSSSTGANYETTYTYDGASQRVASIAESDGTLVQFGYTLVGTDYRVTSITQTVATGVTRVTGLAYDTINRVTTITDAAGQVTRLSYDTNFNLTRIVSPPPAADKAALTTEFVYDGDGNVTTEKLGPGNTIALGYDVHGNLTSQRDGAGNTVTRTYNIGATGRNELLTETRYLVADPDGAGAGMASSPLTTTFVYDSEGHVRYSVSAGGSVTEYRYDGFGNQVSKIDYAAATYASTMTEAALNTWVAAMTNRSGAQRTDTWYDFRGNVARTVTYAALDASGEGTQDPLALFGGVNSTVVQQGDGTYRLTKTSGGNAWNADAHSGTKAEGDFVLQVRLGQSATQMAVGVSSSPTNAGFASIGEGLYFDPNGVVYRVVSGSYTALLKAGQYTTYAAGDSLWMVRTGTTVSYYKGATLSAAMSAGLIASFTGITGTQYVDADVYFANASADIAFTPAEVVIGANTSVFQQQDGLYRITRTSGGNAWNADAHGTAAATGDFALHVRPAQANKYIAAGVSTAPAADTGLTLNYGFYLWSNGTLGYTESGGTGTLGTTFAANDDLWIVRVGSTLGYYKGATLEKAMAAGALRTVTGVTSTLYFDSSFYDLSGVVDVAFTPGALSAPEVSRTDYVYDPAGRLLTRAVAGQGAERYVYDGLARVTASTDFNNVTTTIAYTDATTSTTAVTLANGLVQTSTYDRSGALISYAESGAGMTTVTSTYGYDNLGRLRFVTAPKTAAEAILYTDYFFYDAAGRKIAHVDADGSATEYRYDANGNLTSTTAYATRLNSTQLASLVSGGAPSSVTFDAVRPATDAANDRWSWAFFDAANRAIRGIDGTGAVTVYSYDGTSQLLSTSEMATRMSASDIAALKAAAIGGNLYTSQNVSTFWSLANVSIAANGTINGVNAFKIVTVTTGQQAIAGAFNQQQLVAAGDTVSFTVTIRGEGAMTSAVVGMIGSASSVGNNADSSYEILSGPGTMSYQAGSGFQFTGLSTTTATTIRITRTFTQAEYAAGRVGVGTSPSGQTAGDSLTISNPIVTRTPQLPALPAADAANDRVTRIFYDNDGYAVGSLDAEGYLAQTVYDSAGRKIRSVAYSGATSTTYRASGTFAQLLGTVTLDAAKDIRSYWLYDARGLLRAAIDGEGTVTRYDYSPAGYLLRARSGQKLDPATLAATPPTLATLAAPGGSEVLTDTQWTRNLYGQPLTQSTLLTGSTYTTTAYSYDSNRQLVSAVAQSGVDPRTYSQRYDKQGRLTSELDAIGNAALAALGGSPTQTQIDTIYANYGTSYTYDSAGRLTSKTGPRGTAGSAVAPKTVYYYTADGDLAYEIHSWTTGSDLQTFGEVAEYRYNGFGERTDTIFYATRIVPATFATLTGGLATSAIDTTIHALLSATLDTATHTDYNVDGSVKQSSDALANVSTYSYDAFGDLLTDVVPRDGAATIQTSRTYDRRGLLKSEIVDSASGGKAITTSYGYDAFGRTLTLTNANSKVTTSSYDRKGRIATIKDALNNTTTYTYDARDNLVATTDARGNVTRYVYDTANRRIAAIDAMGGVSTIAYWPDGRVKFTTDYATRISLSGVPLDVTAAGFTPPATNAADHVTTYTYDKDGRLRFTIDALNHVVETVYDVRGNAVRTIAYDGTIAAFTPASVTTDWVATQVAALASAAGTRVTRAVYDANDRVAYTIDAAGQVTFSLHDAKGLLVRQVEFAATYATAGDPLVTDMDGWRAANLNATLDRATYAFYDKAGQLAYSVDPLGYATRLDYDKLGNIKVQTRYAEPYTGTLSLDALNTNYASPPATRRVTEFNYDSAGRLEETLVTVQLSPTVIKTSTRLVLDQMGQILSTIEAYGTADASTTAYTYNDVGRMTSATRGSGAAEASTVYFFYDAVGNNTATIDGDKYLSVSVYDALGNMTASTQYAGVITGAFTTASTVAALQALAGTSALDVAVAATYDSFGRVVTGTDARGSVIARGYDVLDELTSVTEQLETGSGDDRVTSYTYNNFGELAKTHDARGNDSFAWYDLLGRVTRQVDAERYVTDTSYTRGDQVASVKRYDVAIAAGVTISVTSKPDPLGGATFSLTSFTYDKRDDLTGVTDAMGFTESYTLNAFGEQVQVRNKLHGSVVNGVTLDTTVSYTYDGRGRVLTETLPVSTRNSGGTSIPVVNAYTYDLRGNLLTRVEASGAVEARTTTYSYDKLDRLTQTAGDPVTVVNDDLTSTAGVIPTETYKYDHRSNVIESKDAGGARTLTWYDHVGNAVAQVVQTDRVSGIDKGVLTRSAFDGNGNLTSTWTYGDLITLPANANGTIPAAVDTNNYRLVSYTYYRDDRLKETKIAGLTTGEWNGSTYVVTAGIFGGVPNAAAEIKTLVEYDAAGNVVHQRDGRGDDTYMWYDKLGRRTARVDAEGYLTAWTLDGEGNVVSETRYATKPSFTPGQSMAPSGTSNAADRVTTFLYDRNGRRTEEKRLNVAYTAIAAGGSATDIAATDSSAVSKVNYTYNGLGEILTKTEANLADITVSTTVRDTTTYSYDTIGRLTLELGQAFTDFTGATVTPRTVYAYDGLNDLTSIRVQQGAVANDTNDRVTSYVYGAGGRAASMTDATGKTHYYGYDAGGRQVRDSYTRVKSDGSSVTEASVARYDLAGRVVLETVARLGAGSVWKFTVSDTAGAAYYDATRSRYDAYGEMTGRGITGGATGPNDAPVYQQTSEYDAGGRVWRSNGGDGVVRLYVYDKAGNQTLTIASAGADLSARTVSDYTALIGSTGAIAASGSITAANAITTIAVYDKRNQVLATREPGRQLTASTSQLLINAMTYNAFGEVASSTDARGFDASGNPISFTGGAGYTTLYTYNTMGRLLSKVAPQVAVTSEAGATTNVNPTEYYGYDLAGRLVSTRDANGNRSTRQLLAGTGHTGTEALVTREFHPDAGILETKYDVFGDARILRNELYNPSSPNAAFTDEAQSFDKMGRLSSVLHRGGLLTDSYTYDMLGQALTDTESWLVAGTLTSVTAKTDYDTQGRIVRQESFGGDVTSLAISWNAAITAIDATGAAAASAGGWVTVTTTPNTAKTMSKSEDTFGHAISSTDMSGTVTDYRYDRGGRTVRRTTSTDTYNYTYYNGGRLAQTGYTNGIPGTSTAYDLWTESYTYDSVGNELTDVLTKETGSWQDYGHYEYDYYYGYYDQYWVVDGSDFVVTTDTVQNLSTTYDALNRMVTYDAAATNTTPVSSIHYYYDANSNIRRTYATYRNLDQYGYVSTYVPPAQDYWYRYDSMNRVLTAKGVQYGGAVVRGATGTDYSYNVASQRVTAATTTAGMAEAQVYDYYYGYYGGGYYTTYVPYDDERIEHYTYTADGQVATVRIAETSWYDNGDGTVTVNPPSGTGALKSNFTYDQRGRLSRQLDYLYDGDYNTTAAYDRQLTYTAQGQVYTETVNQRQGSDTLVTTTYNGYYDAGGYALGSLTSSSSTTYKNGTWYTSGTTTNTYNWREGAVIASTNIVTYISGGATTNYNTYYYYTASGGLTSAYIVDGQPRNVAYTNDTVGQIIRRDEGYAAPHEVWYRFGGRQLGYIGNNGTLDTDYQTSINNRTAAPGGGGLFQGGSSYSTSTADFDQSLSPINSYSQGGGSGSYTVRGGETLAAIASQLWGDSGLWYKLAEANGLTGSATLAEGQVLAIPGGVMRSTNNASTFSPYQAGAAMGDTSPTTPAPQQPAKAKKNKCGVFGAILLVVIAVAITAIIAPPLIGHAATATASATGLTALFAGATAVAGATTAAGAVFAATVVGGAIAGAVGSVVSQAFGVATGIQDQFSWKGVALAAIGGAVGGAFQGAKLFGAGTGLAKFGSDVARGILSNATTQGIGVATGLQPRFNWVSVAAAGAVSGAVGVANRTLAHNGIGTAAGNIDRTTPHNVGFYANQAISGTAGAIAGAATRSLLDGSDFGDNILNSLPDVIGAVIGNLTADSIMGYGTKAAIRVAQVTKPNMFVKASYGGFECQTAPADDAPQGDIVVTAKRMTLAQKIYYDATHPFETIDRVVTGGVELVKHGYTTYVRPVLARAANFAIRNDPTALVLDAAGFPKAAAVVRGLDRGGLHFLADTGEGVATLTGNVIKAGPRLAGNIERDGLVPTAKTILNAVDPVNLDRPNGLYDHVVGRVSGAINNIATGTPAQIEQGVSVLTSDGLTVLSVAVPVAGEARALVLVDDAAGVARVSSTYARSSAIVRNAEVGETVGTAARVGEAGNASTGVRAAETVRTGGTTTRAAETARTATTSSRAASTARTVTTVRAADTAQAATAVRAADAGNAAAAVRVSAEAGNGAAVVKTAETASPAFSGAADAADAARGPVASPVEPAFEAGEGGPTVVRPLNPDTRFYVSEAGEVLDANTYARNSGFRSGVRDRAWEGAVNPETGLVKDPLTQVPMDKNAPWDMGHKPMMEYWKERDNAINKWLDTRTYTTRKDFLDKMNDPSRYRPELPSSNRSHLGEDSSDLFWE